MDSLQVHFHVIWAVTCMAEWEVKGLIPLIDRYAWVHNQLIMDPWHGQILMPRQTQSAQKWQHVHCVSRVLFGILVLPWKSSSRRNGNHDTAVLH